MSDRRVKTPEFVSSTFRRCRFIELASVFSFALAAFAAQPVAAQSAKLYDYAGKFEDAAFEIESAIVDRGLVVDFVSHVGEMLKRTKDDVGGAKDLYENADVFLFCSAVLSREVMEADPVNLVHCPYKIFVMQMAGSEKVQVGYPVMPDGPMKKVEVLLDEIARGVTAK